MPDGDDKREIFRRLNAIESDVKLIQHELMTNANTSTKDNKEFHDEIDQLYKEIKDLRDYTNDEAKDIRQVFTTAIGDIRIAISNNKMITSAVTWIGGVIFVATLTMLGSLLVAMVQNGNNGAT